MTKSASDDTEDMNLNNETRELPHAKKRLKSCSIDDTIARIELGLPPVTG
jgi:hypothetical protein